VIRVYDAAGNVIETHEHAGEFKEGCVWDMDNEAERLKDFERQHRDLSGARIEEEKEKYLPDFPERKILNRILDERGTQREKAARIASRVSIAGALAAWVGASAAWALVLVSWCSNTHHRPQSSVVPTTPPVEALPSPDETREP